MNVKDFFFTLKNVFGNWKYSLLAIFIALFFYSLNVFIASYRTIEAVYLGEGLIKSVIVFFKFFIDFRSITFNDIFINVIIISVLLGILLGMIAYKTTMLKTFSGKTGFLTTGGIFLGILAPGCAACGVGLLSALGISAATLNFLPFKGFELSIASTIILSFLILRITKDINEGIKCDIK